MHIRIKALFLSLVLMVQLIPIELKAQNFAIDEMRDANTAAIKPFSISRVLAFNGGLRIFLNTADPNVVAGLLKAGALQAQLSDHNAGTETLIPLTLGKAVWCSNAANPIYIAFGDPLPSCNGKPPASIEYFFEAAVVLGPGRDLAIGQDPDFLWLIEES